MAWCDSVAAIRVILMRIALLFPVFVLGIHLGAIPQVLGQAGTADPDYTIGVNNIVESITIEPDGAALVGGSFTTVGGTSQRNLARITEDGSLDTVFNPGSRNTVYAGAVQDDGKIVLAGGFGQPGANQWVGLARLNQDGALDTSFVNPAAGATLRLAIQPDGKILIGGDFTMIAGEPRTFLARLNSNGTLDPGFETVLNASVYGISVQTDGKIVIGGSFTSVNGLTRNRIARLHPDGEIDTAFNASVGDTGSSVETTAIQGDGKILIGGKFGVVNGATRRCLARLNPNGTLDPGFNPDVQHPQNAENAVVLTTALQCDGKIIVGGYFTRVGTSTRLAIARLNPAGSVDAAFSRGATSDSAVQAIGIQGDGKVVVGGAFPSIGGATRTNLARLLNTPATQSLNTPSRTRIEWLRGGSCPEASRVTFQLSTDGGSSWRPVGSGTRITGGWELTGLTLPSTGQIRAQALVACGKTAGLVESVVSYAFPAPDIAVDDPNDFELHDGGISDFGMVDAGSSADLRFKIRNIGTADLTGLGFTIEGVNASEFSLVSAAVDPVVPGGESLFTVRFSPDRPGAKTATLHIASNDEDEGSFDIILTGRSPTAGNLDPGFPLNNVDGDVTSTAVQPDGKILIAGDFTAVGGQPRNRFARLHADGTLESLATFNPGQGADAQIYAVAVQPDGKLLIAGQFKHVDGQPRTAIARLHADGSLESTESFNPGMVGTPDGAAIYALALQPDGKILIGGFFPSVDGQPRNNLARLNPDGTLESMSTFNIGAGANFIVFDLEVQGDGKILVAGRFGSVNGERRAGIARLNPNGTLESTSTFNPGTGPDDWVNCVAVQADGKILLGGNFISVNGEPRSHLARLHPDGSLESAATFLADTDREGKVWNIVVQADGRIVIAGAFQSVNGAPRHYVARLTSSGAVEDTETFDSESMPNVLIQSLALQSDGQLLVNGPFLIGNHANPPRNFARLKNDAAYQDLVVPARDRVQWSRSGTTPEVGHVFFDLSRDGGESWTPLPHGTRTNDGWESTGLKLPASGQIRARGRTAGGLFNSSSGLVEAQANFSFPVPEITLHDGLGMEAPELIDGQTAVVDLGTVRQGVVATRTFKVTNTGTSDLLITGLSAPEGFALGVSSDIPVVVSPAASLTIRLDLIARQRGVFGGELLIASNDEDKETFSFPVAGTVVGPEVVVHAGANTNAPELSNGQVAAVDFGIVRQGSSVAHSFTIANTGSAPLWLSDLVLPPGYTAPSPPPLPTTIEVDQSLTIQIQIDAATLGTFGGNIMVISDDFDEAVFDFPVAGIVVTPEIEVYDGDGVTAPRLVDGQASEVSFGANVQGTPGARTFTIANTGTANLLLDNVTVPPGYEVPDLPALPFTVGINSSLSFQVALTSLVVGIHSGNVVIGSDDYDEALFDFPVTGEVFIPNPESVIVGTSAVLNRQTGLREQTIHVSNDTTATVPAYNLIIRGLPAGVEVYNASATRADGSVVIQVLQGMGPHTAQDIVIEYFSANRQPATPDPRFSTEVVLDPPDQTVPDDGSTLLIDQVSKLPDGEMLLEFVSVPGRLYQIQYSTDGRIWKDSLTRVRAAGNRTQWIDRGPPRTESAPSQGGNRLYRVKDVTP